jgi:signal transduction histidine kinase
MKTVIWAGACSSMARPLKELLESSPSREKSYTLLNNFPKRMDPFLIISQTPELLAKAAHEHPSSLQLLVCNSSEFTTSFEVGVRPLQRFFFILDQQLTDDFAHLLTNLLSRSAPNRKAAYYSGPLPSLQNSLEVLRRITEDRLFELKNFSFQEEERRKHFRSLIHLARSLSMSHDIEEVAHCLWADLRLIDGLRALTLICNDGKGHNHRIASKNGKFHFSELPLAGTEESEILHRLGRNQPLAAVSALNETDSALLARWLKRTLHNPFVCGLASESTEYSFYLLLETDQHWKPSPTFLEYLQERLSFINLSLDKHMLQEELKAKAHLWATTFNDLQDPIAVIDQERKVQRSNLKFQNFKGSHCHSIFNQTETLCNGCPARVEANSSFQLQVGEKIYQTRLFPIQNGGHGLSRHFVAHYVDTTVERILYGKLIQSEKMMAVGRLAGDLSEALSQPLRKIGQLAEATLQTVNLSATIQSDLQEIRKASLRSLNIIADFENFSHGQVEKLPIMAETVVEKTIPLVKSLLHGLRFHVQLSEEKHPIEASLSLLQQVLYNLLKNAQQAMKGQGEIRISSESQSFEDRQGVKISVADSGPGVPEPLRERIFQPFVTSKNSSEGTGLGLNIVKQIVENHDGKVGFQSRPEGGALFWIWIPLQEQPLTTAGRQDHGSRKKRTHRH